jgi:hypothetical protein
MTLHLYFFSSDHTNSNNKENKEHSERSTQHNIMIPTSTKQEQYNGHDWITNGHRNKETDDVHRK